MLLNGERTVRVPNSHPRSVRRGTKTDPVMMMTATRATTTGGISAPPARQAPPPTPCAAVERADQSEIIGRNLRRETDGDRSRWWRSALHEGSMTQGEAMGGQDIPPARQVHTAGVLHWKTRMSTSQKSPQRRRRTMTTGSTHQSGSQHHQRGRGMHAWARGNVKAEGEPRRSRKWGVIRQRPP